MFRNFQTICFFDLINLILQKINIQVANSKIRRERKGGQRETKSKGLFKKYPLIILSFSVIIFFLNSQISEAINGPKEKYKRKSAAWYARVGDFYVSKNHIQKAAKAYKKALKLGRKKFSAKKRIRMAGYLADADNLESAVYELKQLIIDSPSNISARVLLSKFLSWQGKIKESIREINKVLKFKPNHKEALLIKANALSWGGHPTQAILIHKKLNRAGGNFNSKLSLISALAESGDLNNARKQLNILLAKSQVEKRRLKTLKRLIKDKKRKRVILKYSKYEDVDNNIIEKKSFGLEIPGSKKSFKVKYEQLDAKDSLREADAIQLDGKAGFQINPFLWTEGSLGFVELGNAEKNKFLVGDFTTTLQTLKWRFQTSYERTALKDSAKIIENQIRKDLSQIRVRYIFNDRLSIAGKYAYENYSDDNYGWKIQLVPQVYIHLSKPTIIVGYRRDQAQFDTQTDVGYFNPDNFISDQGFLAISNDFNWFNFYVEGFAGNQFIDEFGEKNTENVIGYSVSIGFNIRDRLLLDVEGEGGNFAFGNVSGLEYYQFGISLSGRF
jgi:tetratricopeptide (TPR) repeat protein